MTFGGRPVGAEGEDIVVDDGDIVLSRTRVLHRECVYARTRLVQ